MLNIIFIRHFATEGNRNKRYIGVTDEPLCNDCLQQFDKIKYPTVEAVYTSPLLRCIQTSKLIYPDQVPIVIKNFAECNFGDFENKNYKELNHNMNYQDWINSGGLKPFPNGDKIEDFKSRCIEGFQYALGLSHKAGYCNIALVVHGGTIMSILERYSFPQKGYYDWQLENGQGYQAQLDDSGRLINLCSIH